MSGPMPDFPQDKPLFLFDGHCVLCSRGARFLLRHAPGRLYFASAQSPLGEALYAHFREDADRTYLLVIDGKAYPKSDGYLRLARYLGGWWRIGLPLALFPRRLRDRAYDRIARNRYRWFGQVEQCALLTPEQRSQML